MANAMVALATTTLGSTASSVTFGSIPASYRDLRIVVSGTTTSASVDALVLRLNGDTGSNYPVVYATGDGVSASGGAPNYAYSSMGLIGTSQSVSTIDILDYAQTDKHKALLGRGNTPGWGTRMIAGRWASLSAVTTVLIYTEASLTFSIGTTFSLYGIVSA